MDTEFAYITHRFAVAGIVMQTGYVVRRENRPISVGAHALICHDAMLKEWGEKLNQFYETLPTTARWLDETQTRGESFQSNIGGQPPLTSNCLLVSKIPTSGPQGRLYLPGLTSGGVGPSGRLTSTYLENVQEFMDDWIDELNKKGTEMYLLRPTGLFHAVPRLLVKPYVGRQDRRLVRSRQ